MGSLASVWDITSRRSLSPNWLAELHGNISRRLARPDAVRTIAYGMDVVRGRACAKAPAKGTPKHCIANRYGLPGIAW
jgi:hypothetical protein